MDELKKILKSALVVIVVLPTIAVAFPFIDSPLVECQKYVENWRSKEIDNLRIKVAEATERNKDKLNAIHCDDNVPMSDFIANPNLYCRSISTQINNEYNQRLSGINANYNNKLKACSAKN